MFKRKRYMVIVKLDGVEKLIISDVKEKDAKKVFDGIVRFFRIRKNASDILDMTGRCFGHSYYDNFKKCETCDSVRIELM